MKKKMKKSKVVIHKPAKINSPAIKAPKVKKIVKKAPKKSMKKAAKKAKKASKAKAKK